MNKHQIEYSADYGRYRNQSGNWQYEQMINQQYPEFRSRKKQYPIQKCSIQKYQMLNKGKMNIPKVNDLILNVSDIKGTHTDTLKTDAVRNRMIAKLMRQNKYSQDILNKQLEKQQNIKALTMQTIPTKLSYSVSKMQQQSKFKTQQNSIYNSSQRKLKLNSLPDQLRQSQVNLKKQIDFKKITLPPISINPQKSNSNLKTIEPIIIQNDKNTIQSNNRYSRVQFKHHNTSLNSPNAKTETRYLNNKLKQRLIRINPNFLSFQSEYLLDKNNNYLASYGQNSIFHS